MEATITRRELRLEVAHNVRHIGGYRTRHGHTTGSRIYRAAGLSRLTDGGMKGLVDAGVKAVVDLRSSHELETMPAPAFDPHGIRHIHAPVFERDASPEGLAADAAVEFPGFQVVYQSFLRTGENAYRTLFETIATTDGAVLFHCAAGKDRTGVAAALLLDLVDVHDEHIISDYAESWPNLQPMFEEWKPRMQENGMTEERALRMMSSDPEDIEHTLAHIRATWGSAEGYLRSIGISQSTIDTVRARILE